MTPSDRPAFAATLVELATVKPAGKLTAEALEIWWRAMQHWDIAEFRAAAQHLMRTTEFMPNPFHFEQLRAKANEGSADEAWEQIIHEHGQCDDETGYRALRSLGGWSVVGFVETTRLPWLKERFREAYENFAESLAVRDALPMLGGPRSRGALSGPAKIGALLANVTREDSDGE